MLVFFSFICLADLNKVIIKPFDFQSEADPETHVKGLRNLYKDKSNSLIFIPENEPFVIYVNTETRGVVRLGGKGGGPGELGISHPSALSASDRFLWVLDTYQKRLTLFSDGKYQTDFKTKGYQIRRGVFVKYAFAHNDQFVVLPAHPGSRKLANVYDYSGEVVAKMGDILPIDPEMLDYNPAVNNTIWRYQNSKWYCLFVFRPTIRIFNQQFQLERELLIVGEEVDYFEEFFHKRHYREGVPSADPHFTDFQVTEKHIYALCKGVLYQMTHDGKVITRTGFFASDEIAARVGHRPRVHFNDAIVIGNRVYLGSRGHYQDHDLWYADLPK